MKSSQKEIILQTENLYFRYSSDFEITNISYEIHQSSLTGIIGPNGSGKSTLLKLSAGLLEPDRGKIYLLNRNIKKIKSDERSKIISYIPQLTDVFLPFCIEEIVSMGRYPYKKHLGFLTENDIEIVNYVIRTLKIDHLRKRQFSTLSAGEKQKVFLASSLVQSSNLLLLDEPTSSLDIHHKNEIYSILKGLTKRGTTILVVSHDITLASLYCDKLLLISDGNLIKYGKPIDIINEEILIEVFGKGIKILWEKNKPYIVPEKI